MSQQAARAEYLAFVVKLVGDDVGEELQRRKLQGLRMTRKPEQLKFRPAAGEVPAKLRHSRIDRPKQDPRRGQRRYFGGHGSLRGSG